jgi:alanine racemase
MVGRVSMDSVGVEVGDKPVVVGDEAEAFGEGIPVEEAAAAAGTISYELLVGVGTRVPRVHVDT